MSVRTDVINLNVNVNGNKAQNELNNLRKRAADVKLEMEGLGKRTAEYTAKKKELAEITTAMGALKQQIGLSALSQKELTAELKKLQALKGSVVPFSKEFNDLQKQIDGVNKRLYDVKNGVQGFASFFSKIKDEVKQFGVVAAGYLGFQFITSQFQNIVSGAGKMSDQLADLQRVAGLTAGEVKIFNSELSKIDTRTSTEGLRQIAITAGKLGVAKDDLLGFTKAVDMLVVTLGDELGDAGAITDSLGKILNVFDGEIKGDSITKLGNAFVELANTGSASGAFIADFDQRLSGIAKSAGISLGALSGLGAGLEEMGARVESSSTAIQKLIISISSDIPAAAKIAGESTEEFEKLFKLDPTEALLRYSQGLVKNKQSFSEVTASLADAGEEGARTIETITKLGGSADYLRGRIDLGKESIERSAAITEGFRLKNETFGATLDKLGKEFNGFVAKLTGAVQAVVNGLVGFIRVLKDLPQFFADNRTAIILLTGVLLTYLTTKLSVTKASIANRLATLLETAADKLEAFQKARNIFLTSALALAKGVLTRQITLATVATRLFNAIMKLNPLGIFITLVTAAATALSFFSSGVKKATDAEQNHAEILGEVAKATSNTKSQIETLTKVVTSSTASTIEKTTALEKLKAISHEYLDGLTLENIATQDGIDIIKKYITSLDALATAKARVNLKAKLREQQLENDNVLQGLEVEKAGASKRGFFDSGGEDGKLFGLITVGGRSEFNVKEDITKETENKVKIQARLKALDTDNDKQIEGYRKTIAVKQSQLKGLQKDSDMAKKLARDIASDQKVLFTLTGLDDGAAAPTSGGGGAPAADGSVAAYRKKLQAQLDALKSSYDSIDALNEKARAKNLAGQKKLQDQLTRLDGGTTKGDRSAAKKEESQFKQDQKEADKFYKDLLKLKEKAGLKELPQNEAELEAVRQKYAELLARAKDFLVKKIIDSKKFGDEEKLIEEAKQSEIDAIIKKHVEKRFQEQAATEYDDALLASAEYFDEVRVQAAQAFADNKITRQEYDAQLKSLDRDELADRITIATDYSANVKKAATDVTQFKKQQEKQTTADLIEETENRKALSDSEKMAQAQRGVLTSKGKGIDAEIVAKKNLLQLQFDLDTQYLDKKSELYQLKEAELQDAIAETDKQGLQAKIDNVMTYVGYFSDALSSLNNIVSQNENKTLAKEKKVADGKKKDLKKQLDGRLISQEQYDKKVGELDEQQQRKESEVKRKKAIREKALNLFNAVINNASAIVKTMTSVPYPFNIPLAVAQGIAGGLQIKAIANQEIPELGKGDWVRTGDKHSDPSRGIPVKIERDEAVMNAAAMTDPEPLTVTGTTAQITSALNSRKGRGVNWAGGATVTMPRWRTDPSPQINPGLVRYMATGGLGSGKTSDNGSGASMEETNALLKSLIAKQEENNEEIRTMKTKLHAVVSIKEYREQEAQYEASKKVSGIKQ